MCVGSVRVKRFPEPSLMRECERAATDCWPVTTRWREREEKEEEGEDEACELDR